MSTPTEFFTADEHYETMMPGRPFENTDEATTTMIYHHNNVVDPSDTVYHLGDLCHFGEDKFHYYKNLLKRLNGRKHLILGNHDKCDPFFYVDMGFTSVHTSLKIDLGGQELVLSHDPCIHCFLKQEILVSGHTHTLYRCLTSSRAFNVGVDLNYYTPVSIHTILKSLHLTPSGDRNFEREPPEAGYVNNLAGV